jgi:F0F1-type ATP synthase membrane subunit c/vacuolar-type H+-ATPase subunit K
LIIVGASFCGGFGGYGPGVSPAYVYGAFCQKIKNRPHFGSAFWLFYPERNKNDYLSISDFPF